MTKKQTKKFDLEELFCVIKNKISDQETSSYTYELANAGVEKITRKIGEEAIEVVIAAFLNDKKKSKKTRTDLIGEVSDLFYHNLVLLASQDIEFDEVLKELNNRNKIKNNVNKAK